MCYWFASAISAEVPWLRPCCSRRVDFPADEHAIALMRERDLDIAMHRARQLTAELITATDLILVMEAGHKRAIDMQDPTARGKVYRLCEWQDEDIPDPYRQPRKAFEEALELIEKGVQDWAEKITKSDETAK